MTEQPPIPPPPTDQVPVCPRHPDRESYVRCQRCGRPTCPECQRPAAVGIQCVDCVREGARTVRQGRTVFGGSATDGRPLVTMTIIGICVAVYLLQQVVPGLTNRIAFVPALADTEPWRFLTSGFAHGPIYHIAFNMYALWIMGQYLEPLLGRARFVALYVLSAVGGSVVYLLMSTPQSYQDALLNGPGSWYTSAVGASGAVFGLFGAFLVLQRRLGRSAAGMYVIIGINAVIGFVIPGIAWQAHLGGLVTGAACAAAIGYLGRAKGPMQPGDRRIHWAALAAVGIVLVLLAVARYSTA
ncbi:rhomboid family intramembrane serine protease [Phycicoccus sonneratiae]|uniref:rhomboid family intramembrane serine protease n=1 Tax=Phycicoccus sonneratiae TaxID=2807628 RepID=UPI0027DDA838|nr:rhomboid family intramembrane serine protease [Phycicoccus sonneraticus]